MEQLQSAKSALQRALAEIETAIAALSTGENGASQECNEPLANSESSDELSDGQSRPWPSKASVHIDQEEAPVAGELDPRFQQGIWWAAAAGQYGNGEEFPISILRHRNASRCPSGVA
ncbi:integral membrane protein PTH11 [Fusarium denticulatum]|uniref:Integral membrane protein PTH11 n=1 Tax=Fusarium denticulatum TaxID=48507 RepID=A0A8H5XJP1_9HYPO|nr:integral membrane protein PTH11 [Fusarium denticulatum]